VGRWQPRTGVVAMATGGPARMRGQRGQCSAAEVHSRAARCGGCAARAELAIVFLLCAPVGGADADDMLATSE
jgi:hypothetical protein